ncbi:P-loop NTPase fold protein, partial [Candidatus Zixiibacteriota bacterium]
VVVDFNAWRHQRIGPPWWALMNALFTKARRSLWTSKKSRWAWLCLREFWWRAGMRRVLIFLGLAGFVVLGWGIGLWRPIIQAIFGESATSTDMISGIATVSMLVLGTISGIWRWLRLGRPSRAQKFLEFAKDPMGPLVEHYNCLVKLIKRPIALFIDDLDRCQVDYVVRLLEGIQTIFVDAPVVYVIASDRRWLCTSFETAYESFGKTVNEPGRPLGHFFLEKTFQMSFPVPRISDTAKKEYLDRLLRVTRDKTDQEIEDFTLDARQEMETAETEQEIQQRVEESRGTDREQFVRQAAVVKKAERKFEERTKHVLSPFLDLMTPNPRAMKRLINAFGMNDTTSILAGLDLPTEQLALWTILDLQWPVLAVYLEKNPEIVEHIGAEKAALPQDIPAELRGLFLDEDVRRVIKGDAEGVSAELDAVTIREKCALLRS